MKESQIKPYEHSDIKVKLLQLYLERYVNILSLSKHVQEVDVYDVFCGEGIYENEKEGSPLIILKILRELKAKDRIFGKGVQFNTFFNDFDTSKIEKLSSHVEGSKLHDSEIGKLQYFNEDYNLLKPRLMNNSLSKSKKTFIFIDPYGYKEINLTDISLMLADRNTEILLFLPAHFMYRFENNAPTCLYDFLTEVFQDDSQQRSMSGIEFIHKLRDGFGHKLQGKHYVDSFIISRDKNQFFALFFFTSHIYGFEKFLEAKWKIDEEEGRGWSPVPERQIGMFDLVEVQPNTDKFSKELRTFLKEERTNNELYQFTVENRHLVTHAVQILKELQGKGVLSVLSPTDRNPLGKNTFYIAWEQYKNNDIKSLIKIR